MPAEDQQKHGRRLARFIKRYRLAWGVLTLAIYIIAVPVSILVFPSNSLWLALLVLFSGATATLMSLGDMLVSAETSDQADDDINTESEPSEG